MNHAYLMYSQLSMLLSRADPELICFWTTLTMCHQASMVFHSQLLCRWVIYELYFSPVFSIRICMCWIHFCVTENCSFFLKVWSIQKYIRSYIFNGSINGPTDILRQSQLYCYLLTGVSESKTSSNRTYIAKPSPD